MGKRVFKEVFIFVAGTTPQVITETIYALAIQTPPVFPEELFIITTTKGKEAVINHLVKRGILEELIKEYDLPPVSLKEDSFIVPFDKKSIPLEDIRDSEDNEIVGNTIVSFIKEKTRDLSTRLHCSIAGGRKTMGFYLGSALQLFGRPWDKLYHVLVSPEFELNPEFFYKPKKDRIIECRMPDGTTKRLNTRDAVITCAELPFIRLTEKISLEGWDFRDLIMKGQAEIDMATIQPLLTVNLKERTITIGDKVIVMPPIGLMIYTAFLRQKIDNCRYLEKPYCIDCTECFMVLADFSSRSMTEQMAKDYMRIYKGSIVKSEEFIQRWKDGIDLEVLRQNISKINRAIKSNIDERLSPYYCITSLKSYGSSRYGIRLEKGKIRIG